ncbi:cd7 antigen-like [Eucyclogobius newberryi]|uniref:cd7 antigen-like n=1 Tax=Eucyclogobius newberryi TaxID=166745 RepID=UPI003B5AD1FF
MIDFKCLCLWTLIVIHADTVLCSSIQFVARDEGDQVVLSCLVDQTTSPPIGVYLKRSWLRRTSVLFKYEGSEVSILDQEYHNRTSVSGDPNIHALNVTISGLRPSDTDRYYCEFNVNTPHAADTVLRGNKEFFLFVSGVLDVDRDLVNTCVGGSALVPCVPPVGDGSAVEGVVLKRKQGQQHVELLYHSKHTSWPSQFPVDRVQLNTAPGPGGISYSLTVGDLQPEDSGLYSCQLLLQGRPHSPSMGPQGLYVSVQGDQCGCSSYSTLIYALSAAVAVTLALLVVVVLVYRGNRPSVKTTHTTAPIYEEMTGLQPNCPKRSRGPTDEPLTDYRNISLKDSCPENHYESPSRAINSKLE